MDGQGEQTPNQPDRTPVNIPDTPSAPEQPAPPPSTADYANYMPPKKPKSRVQRLVTWVVIGLAVIALAVGGYHVIHKKKPPTSNPSTTQSSTPSQAATSQINSKTAHYSSQNFTLEFDYPADWTVADTTGSGIMSVKSPSIQLNDASGQKVAGQISLTFRAKTQKLTEFNSGNAMAARDSKKVSYTKPTQTQRGQTYVSFLRYASDTNSAGLDGVYITGDSGYKVGQAIPLVDITKVDPVVSLIFAKCSDSNCSKPQPLAISASSWDDSSFATPLETMIKSLIIK